MLPHCEKQIQKHLIWGFYDFLRTNVSCDLQVEIFEFLYATLSLNSYEMNVLSIRLVKQYKFISVISLLATTVVIAKKTYTLYNPLDVSLRFLKPITVVRPTDFCVNELVVCVKVVFFSTPSPVTWNTTLIVYIYTSIDHHRKHEAFISRPTIHLYITVN